MLQLMTYARRALSSAQPKTVTSPEAQPPIRIHRSGATTTSLWQLWAAQQSYFTRLARRWMNGNQDDAAQAYSKEMALRDHGGHVSEDGSPVSGRVTRTGYRWSAVGENVAYGQTTPEQVMFAWMHSDGHRKNILKSDYQEIGIGYYFLRNDAGKSTITTTGCRTLPCLSKAIP